MSTIKRVLGWLKPYRKLFLRGYVLVVAAMALRMVLPYISEAVVNDVLPHQDMHLMLILCAVLILVTALRAVMVYCRGLTFERISQNIVYDLRTGIYHHMQELPYSFYDKHHIGEIMSRLTGDVEGVRSLVMNASLGAVENILMFVFSLLGMFSMSWQLTLTMLLLCPLIVFLAWKFRSKVQPEHVNVREQNAVLNTRTQENIAGVRVVKAFAREEYEKEQFAIDNYKVRDYTLRVTQVWSTYFPLLDMAASLATPLLLIVGSALVVAGKLSIGALVGSTGFVWMLISPMRQVANYVNIVSNGLVSSEKLIYYMDFGSVLTTPEHPVEPEKREGAVDFNHVSMRYDGKTVLEDIDLHVKPGETVAVMGATGAGKTTLVNLIARYYDVSDGSVCVDGVDVRKHELQKLRGEVGMVMQETFLFSETLFNNIRFGRPDASREDVMRAADAAQVTEFAEHMPHGFDTVVGERGLGLSGGQKQRVALARALLYNPRILILDDATSAIDMETEALIQDALRRVMENRTTFIIAHRISSVRRADQIIVLDKGRIAERGTHAELLARHGLYEQMYLDQTRDFDVSKTQKAGD